MFHQGSSTAEFATFLSSADNIGVLIRDRVTGAVAVVDAPEAAPVETALKETGWQLTHILITHHHHDHTGGIDDLRKPGITVVGAAADAHRLPKLDIAVTEGEVIKVGSLEFSVLDVPGHTVGHLAYVLAGAPPALFCGDLLFSLGCGRIFEGTPDQMWRSLAKVKALPEETLVWCGHEYTRSNARFALAIAPGDNLIIEAAAEAESILQSGRLTIPARLGHEMRSNPFLRADDTRFAAAIGQQGHAPAEVFGYLRRAKDHFK